MQLSLWQLDLQIMLRCCCIASFMYSLAAGFVLYLPYCGVAELLYCYTGGRYSFVIYGYLLFYVAVVTLLLHHILNVYLDLSWFLALWNCGGRFAIIVSLLLLLLPLLLLQPLLCLCYHCGCFCHNICHQASLQIGAALHLLIKMASCGIALRQEPWPSSREGGRDFALIYARAGGEGAELDMQRRMGVRHK